MANTGAVTKKGKQVSVNAGVGGEVPNGEIILSNRLPLAGAVQVTQLGISRCIPPEIRTAVQSKSLTELTSVVDVSASDGSKLGLTNQSSPKFETSPRE